MPESHRVPGRPPPPARLMMTQMRSDATPAWQRTAQAFPSQTESRSPELGPVLSPGMLAHFTRATEVLFR
jgi:hypothetical protein